MTHTALKNEFRVILWLVFCAKTLARPRYSETGKDIPFRRDMRPEEGARKQIEIYKAMSGKERLRLTFEMWEAALAVTKASERAMNPDLSDEEIEKRARTRMTGGTAESH